MNIYLKYFEIVYHVIHYIIITVSSLHDHVNI